ncbi:MAG TPA: Gfo/Idh/MocA family oxidoreductase [Chthoniobacterales bacterium]|jgi:predicted dehydrogenase|nr:Gfo/Idh/MocA family oxidoreductase [Chthoniobacterales bacterium]
MNGVTGRMGRNQHLLRSILALQQEGGLQLKDGTWLYPEPVLIGRDQRRTQELANELKIARWTTDLTSALADHNTEIYFDTQITSERATAVKAAIEAGKHVYCEKPVADNLAAAIELALLAKSRGVKNGVVQDKLFLPGIRKLQRLVSSGFFGRILSVRGEFGYWVFDGYLLPGQRPSWNYRSEDGGGIILDMFCHWRYLLESIFGPVQSVIATGATHIPARADEQGRSYSASADDAAYAIFELDKGVIAQINSSWCVRVYRDELFSLQVDGTNGSAVAGLRHCKVQHRVCTPVAVWNPDLPDSHDFFADWSEVPDNQVFDNAFKTQWELFLRHVVEGGSFPHSLLEGAKGVQLAEAGMQSWRERRWIDLPELTLR